MFTRKQAAEKSVKDELLVSPLDEAGDDTETCQVCCLPYKPDDVTIIDAVGPVCANCQATVTELAFAEPGFET